MSLIHILSEALSFVVGVGCYDLGTGKEIATGECPGSVLYPATAALASKGYWVQSYVVNFLYNLLLYHGWFALYLELLLIIIGIVLMAFGFRPRQWLWLFLAPFVLCVLDPTVPVYGVRWYQGDNINEDAEERKIHEQSTLLVWKIVVAREDNTSIWRELEASRLARQDVYYLNDRGVATRHQEPPGTIRISSIFLWLDGLLTDVVEFTTSLTGLFEDESSQKSINIQTFNPAPNVTYAPFSKELPVTKGNDSPLDYNSEWLLPGGPSSYRLKITEARIYDEDLKLAFAKLMSPLCGNALKSLLDQKNFLAENDLTVPKAQEIFNPEGSLSTSCDRLLMTVIQGFRSKAGLIYYEMIKSLPPGSTPLTMLKTLFNITCNSEGEGERDFSSCSWGSNLKPCGSQEEACQIKMSKDEIWSAVPNLIFLNLFLNEFSSLQGSSESRLGESEITESSGLKDVRQMFWVIFRILVYISDFLPILQGIFLYLLSISFPFIFLTLVYPWWYRIALNWMLLFVWTKLWDLGFAVVIVVDRFFSQVTMNQEANRHLFERIAGMARLGNYGFRCSGHKSDNIIQGLCDSPGVPEVVLGGNINRYPIMLRDILSYLDEGLKMGNTIQAYPMLGFHVIVVAMLYLAVPIVIWFVIFYAKSLIIKLLQSLIEAISFTIHKVSRTVLMCISQKRLPPQ